MNQLIKKSIIRDIASDDTLKYYSVLNLFTDDGLADVGEMSITAIDDSGIEEEISTPNNKANIYITRFHNFRIEKLKIESKDIMNDILTLECGAACLGFLVMSKKAQEVFSQFNLGEHTWEEVTIEFKLQNYQYYVLKIHSAMDDHILYKRSVFKFQYTDEEGNKYEDKERFFKVKVGFHSLMQEQEFDKLEEELLPWLKPFIVDLDKNWDKDIDCSMFYITHDVGELCISERLYWKLKEENLIGLAKDYVFYAIPTNEEQPLFYHSKTAIKEMERAERREKKRENDPSSFLNVMKRHEEQLKMNGFEKVYKIILWSDWLKEVSSSVTDFYNIFEGAIPNVLEANAHTFSQFEFIADISPIGGLIQNVDTKKIANKTNKPIKITELTFQNECTLFFHVNEKLLDREFKLRNEHSLF